MLEELKFVASAVVTVTVVFFTVPVALTAGIAVAQKIGVVECVTPQNQTEIQK